MADEEAEQDHSTEIGSADAIGALRERLQELATELTESREPAMHSASQYCQKFCQVSSFCACLSVSSTDHVTLCVYAAELGVKMADEEAEQDHSTEIGSADAIGALRERLQELATELTESREPAMHSASQYCQKFCQVLQ
ncbi:Zinc finger protein 292 [Acipenser ruthenus]|uniref:Zinc finger protein 292 n=1 Tax=Acipenser ruthenus TaxID=7906 RepID=A0A444UWS2_ACIRT|nr:Zinc finger protein 292 [Acipenser ruthenus]